MSGTVSEIIGVFAAIVVVAGVSVAIVNGGKTAKIIGAIGNTFVSGIQAATLQSK